MLLPLDSPVWNELECAHGSAAGIPDLIKTVCDPALDESKTRDVWSGVWDSLCHQDSVYSATYAAVPHFAGFIPQASLVWRLELLLFTGRVLAYGALVGKPLSVKLIEGFSQVVDKIAAASTATISEAKKQNLLSNYPSSNIAQSYLALQFGCDPTVQLLQSIIDNDMQIKVLCPGCDETNIVEIDSLKPNETTAALPDDESVSAGTKLASELDDAVLERRIASLRSNLSCKNCSVEFTVYDGYL